MKLFLVLLQMLSTFPVKDYCVPQLFNTFFLLNEDMTYKQVQHEHGNFTFTVCSLFNMLPYLTPQEKLVVVGEMEEKITCQSEYKVHVDSIRLVESMSFIRSVRSIESIPFGVHRSYRICNNSGIRTQIPGLYYICV